MDEELRLLLLDEVERRRREAAEATTVEDARRIAHAVKGTFAMAGAAELSASAGRLERRLAQGDAEAVSDLATLLTMSAHLLREGKRLPESTWPEPPHDLTPSQIPPEAAQPYVEAITDRVSRIDAALTSNRAPDDKLREVLREVHTIKGAALATGDEAMAWFCHGLEELLRAAAREGHAERALEDMETHRSFLAALATDPTQALSLLRGRASIPSPPSRVPEAPLPLPPRRPTVDARESEGRALADATVRVPSAVIDSLFERSLRLGLLRPRVTGVAAELEERRAELTRAVSRLREAARLIGPPRPWGAPARAIDLLRQVTVELSPLADELDTATSDLRQIGKRVAADSGSLTRSVHDLRTTSVQTLFDRVAASAATEARHQAKALAIVQQGADVKIDRTLADALVEPLRQIVRNSLVHGLESAEERLAVGKRALGTITLRASHEAGLVSVAVEDDGRGVDASDVRRRASELGIAPPAALERMGDAEVLDLLFAPGFSMRAEADLMAGRGVGLDLSHAAVERLGGTIHLASTPGAGLVTTLAFPAEGSLVKVLWVRDAGAWFAMPVLASIAVVRSADAGCVPIRLSTLVARPRALRGRGGDDADDPPRSSPEPGAYALSLGARTSDEAPLFVGVEAVGAIEDVVVRPMPPLARVAGPYASVIAFGDELRMVLDPLRLRRLASAPRPDASFGPPTSAASA